MAFKNPSLKNFFAEWSENNKSGMPDPAFLNDQDLVSALRSAFAFEVLLFASVFFDFTFSVAVPAVIAESCFTAAAVSFAFFAVLSAAFSAG
ncbi:hypothetical protein [Acinetobacter sp. WZC-1]|uniref:hypothetical protein n=1 Tax=Acinetobacter sp. WZC-1 TaxID=3459034 RepID=UPI00403E09F8